MRFSFIFLVILALTPVAVDTYETDSENWVSTDLNLEGLIEIANNDTCYADRLSFFGCMTGLESAVMISKDQSSISIYFEKLPVNEVKDVKAIKHSFEFKSMKSLLKHFNEQQKNKVDRWASLYKLPQRIDFESLFRQLVNERKQNKKEYIASIINSYLSSSFSPHDHIIPNSISFDKTKNFMGIGVQLQTINNNMFVLSTTKGSPADRAGLKSGDLINKIQGKNVSKMKLTELLGVISNSSKDLIEIEYYRNEKKHSITLKKALISTENTQARYSKNGSWAIIDINDFLNADTCSKVESYLFDIFSKDPVIKGLILDLRDNQGGLVSEAVCVADLFLPYKKKIVEVRPTKNEGEYPVYYNSENDPMVDLDIPVVTLVNSYTASAAEILAGSLKVHERSILLGERTFGKGSVMRGVNLSNYNDILYYQTFALMYFASGSTNHIKGIMPDYVLDTYNNVHSFREMDLFFYKYSDLGHNIDYSSNFNNFLSKKSSSCLTNLSKKNISDPETAAGFVLGCVNGIQ